MRVKKWVREGKRKIQVDTELERFDLYLHVEEDAELIDMLKHLRRRHRVGQRLRDLLYAGLETERANKPRLALPARASLPVDSPRQQTGGEIPENTSDQVKVATNNFLNAFG